MTISRDAIAAATATWLEAAEFALVLANTADLRARGLLSEEERRYTVKLAGSLRNLARHYQSEAERLGAVCDPDLTPPDGTPAVIAHRLRRSK